MIELEKIKAKSVTVPKRVKRYGLAYYTASDGWRLFYGPQLETTPEGILQSFITCNRHLIDEGETEKNRNYYPKYYKIFELDLEIPLI